ncbi:TPA: hypothetical protein ACHVX6_000282 [Listeria monocytogenes]|uniref:hypothetical protein n=1 Tax=Listeria monocytogenes TaxID=1639 RepID=UPI000D1D6321|nr:hypothetical protein [Listeria monocytogenes]EHC6210334.1 hypothetical protein [Listeria monocytogenes serotype 1/2b]AVV06798.1 hypothetical protein CXL08_07405 [Listeria monocytogenes]EAC4010620.1 hypothetical protein [Listeria monocytogenes]EAE6173285.1 hypothetical protein [Listeria monocytogenes]EAF6833205.1 hypothetical protein [Listeria monocytogenes]
MILWKSLKKIVDKGGIIITSKKIVLGADGKIYLSNLTKEGFMTETKRNVTKEVLRVVLEFFMLGDKKLLKTMGASDEPFGALVYINDSSKVSKILDLLEE